MTDSVIRRRLTMCFASAATVTAACVSTVAGWQRGGWLSERLLWVAIGVVLVASAHLLPALCRSSSMATRIAGGGLWLCCMLTICYGHATFFLLAQQHAGETRAVSIDHPPLAEHPGSSIRSLVQIATERAHVVTALAVANARRCSRDCPSVRLDRVSLAARLDALNIEAREAQRQETESDRAIAAIDHAEKRRDDARVDPVTGRVAAFLGVKPARVELLSGLAFAGVLEGVACLLWLVALGEPAGAHASIPVTAPESVRVTASRKPVTPADSGASLDGDVARLVSDIAAGRLRATVADIRRHLGCSQSRALTLRRQLAGAG